MYSRVTICLIPASLRRVEHDIDAELQRGKYHHLYTCAYSNACRKTCDKTCKSETTFTAAEVDGYIQRVSSKQGVLINSARSHEGH